MLVIDDDILKAAGWTDEQARVEVAVAFYRLDRLSLEAAAGLANVEPAAFAEELIRRGVAVYTISPQELEDDCRALDEILKKKQAS